MRFIRSTSPAKLHSSSAPYSAFVTPSAPTAFFPSSAWKHAARDSSLNRCITLSKRLRCVPRRQPRYPLEFRVRRVMSLCWTHGVSLQRATSPRVLCSTGITPLHHYYDPSDFLTAFSTSSPSRRMFADTALPRRAPRTSHVHLLAVAACRALRPRGCHPSLPTLRNRWCCLLYRPHHRPSQMKYLTGLHHFNLLAYGLQPLCLRLAPSLPIDCPRLDTGCGGLRFPGRTSTC